MKAFLAAARVASAQTSRRCGRGSAVLFALLLLGLLSVTARPVRAEAFLRLIGGDRGGQFIAPCPAGQNLLGFELRAGDTVDAIRPVCVFAFGPSEISNRSLTNDSGLVPVPGAFAGIINAQQVAPGWFGGPGGGIVRVLCPASTPI